MNRSNHLAFAISLLPLLIGGGLMIFGPLIFGVFAVITDPGLNDSKTVGLIIGAVFMFVIGAFLVFVYFARRAVHNSGPADDASAPEHVSWALRNRVPWNGVFEQRRVGADHLHFQGREGTSRVSISTSNSDTVRLTRRDRLRGQVQGLAEAAIGLKTLDGATWGLPGIEVVPADDARLDWLRDPRVAENLTALFDDAPNASKCSLALGGGFVTVAFMDVRRREIDRERAQRWLDHLAVLAAASESESSV